MASNKMYALHSARIVYTLVQLAFILVLFECVGPSLEYIGVAYLLSACLFTVLIWAVSKRINPDLRYRRHLYDPHLLKEMGGLGMWTILTTIGVLMFIQTSLVLVNIFLGEHEGGSFALITIMISMTNTTCMTLTTIIAPLLYHQYARGDIGTLTAISKASMRFIGLLMAFPVAYLCIFATQILELWSKGEFSGSTDILFIMFVVQIGVCAVSTLEVIPIIYLKIRPVAIATVLFGLINIVGTVLVLQFTDWGIIGAAAVWTVTMLALNFGYYPLFMSRLLSLKWHTFLKPLVPGYLAMAACFAVGLTVTHFWTLPTTWAAVLISFSVLFVIYLMVAFTMGLGKEDKKLIMKVMPNVVKKLVARHTAEK
jgi:membrane protein EpsK